MSFNYLSSKTLANCMPCKRAASTYEVHDCNGERFIISDL